MKPLSGKVALVTGGTRGIGRAISTMLLMEGASVVICGRTAEHTARVVRELSRETGGKVAGQAADVREGEEVAGLFELADREFGRLDILVNNAGVGVFKPMPELSLEDLKLAVETNLYGAFHASRAALLRFRQNGNVASGHIVQISSLAGKNAFAGGAAYNASKFGMTGFSEAMMQDVRSQGVRVSTVFPGSVATEFGGGTDGKDWKIWPEDIAQVVKMLLLMPERTLVSSVEVRPVFTKTSPKR
jgi:NAD(P)-dependent dehydrogenase (short-subunit alcohol dehydrogenase family)